MNYNDVIDTASAKERFMGNYALFRKFLYRFPDETLFTELEAAAAAGDVKKAFEAAHTMKGVAGNLSLKLIEKPLHCVVEELRAGRMPEADKLGELTDAYNKTIESIAALKEEDVSLF